MKTFKRCVSLVLVSLLLSSCALSEDWLSALFGNVNGPRLSFVAVPDEAFTSENGRVLAATADGQYAVILSKRCPYIWSMNEQKRIQLSFESEEDLAELNLRADTSALMSAPTGESKEQREKRQEELVRKKQAYLQEKGIEMFMCFEDAVECYGGVVGVDAAADCIAQRYAIFTASRFGVRFLCDMRTGRCRLIYDTFTTLCEDRLLTDRGIESIETGESHIPSYEQIDGEKLSLASQPNAIRLLKDDSVLLLFPGSEIKRESFSRETYLFDVAPGWTRALDLGEFPLTMEPRTLTLTWNERYAAAHYLSPYVAGDTVILDRESGEVKPIGADELMLFASTEDSFICYDLKKFTLVLLNPETLERSSLSVSGYPSGGPLPLTVVSSVVGNGEGKYFVQRELVRGYFELVQ